jgi:uncharacterized membrane protein
MKSHSKNLNIFLFLFCFFIVIAALSSRFFAFEAQSLWTDEGLTILLTDSESVPTTARLLLGPGNGNWYLTPAYFFALSVWRGIFGSSETALRCLSAIFGSMAVLVVVFASWRAWGWKWACWTGVFAALSGYSVYYSQEIRPYALLLLTSSLILATYLECRKPCRDGSSLSAKIALTVAAFVAVWSSVLSALLLTALALSDLLVSRGFGRWFKLWLPPAIAASTFALWIVAHFLIAGEARTFVAGFQAPFVLKAGFLTTGLSVGTTFGAPLVDLRGSDQVHVLLEYAPQYLLLGLSLALICGLLITVGLLSWRVSPTSDVRLQVLISTTVLLFAIFLALELFFGVGANPRNAFALWPLICLILPAVSLFSGFAEKSWLRHFGASAMTALIALNIVSLKNYFFNEKYWRDDFRAVAEYIDQYQNYVPILLNAAPRTLTYYSGQAIEYIDIGDPLGELNPVERLHALLKDQPINGPGLIVIINRPDNYRQVYGEFTTEMLEPDFLLAEETFPHYFHVYRFKRTDKGHLEK